MLDKNTLAIKDVSYLRRLDSPKVVAEAKLASPQPVNNPTAGNAAFRRTKASARRTTSC